MALINGTLYDLTAFFSQCHSAFSAQHAVNPYNYEKMLSCYKHILESFPDDINILKMIKDDEHYYRDIIFPNGHYTLFWSIPVLREIVKSYQIQSVPISIDAAYDAVDTENVLEEHLHKRDSDPIFIALTPFLTAPWIIVDGNHRVISNYENGASTIDGYLIPLKLYISAIPSYFLQTLLKIHNNIWLFSEYQVGHITSFELHELLCNLELDKV